MAKTMMNRLRSGFRLVYQTQRTRGIRSEEYVISAVADYRLWPLRTSIKDHLNGGLRHMTADAPQVVCLEITSHDV